MRRSPLWSGSRPAARRNGCSSPPTLRFGGGASGILVSSTARDAGIGGVEFLRSIPGTVGGFARMNGGAYGREVKDVLIDCEIVLRTGQRKELGVGDLGYSYRHS